uniref:Glycine cleavage system P protein n=1 Tax=Panagrellus redivivus TaxID=6233 RepID=A0A7E4V1I6_PANRE
MKPARLLFDLRRHVASRVVGSVRAFNYDCFADRHIGPSELQKQQMLQYMGFRDLDQLTNTNVPENIKLNDELHLPAALDEWRMLTELREIVSANHVYRSYIGMGFNDCIVPKVIISNLLQNAGWTSPYTPYQPEIAQGRLESLLNFQTMVSDLTGLETSNASLLDEATACAEAACLAARYTKRNTILYDTKLHPQNFAVLKTRAEPLGIKLVPLENVENPSISKDVAGVIVQYPNTEGKVYDLTKLIENTHEAGGLAILACDILSLTMLRSPGELGADIAIGSAQRFGLPLGYGGPHPAFMSVAKTNAKNTLARMMPGRIVGVSRDAQGNPAYRLALQTREQHIRRDKATSNICTAQALPANIAAMYAVYHGPHRLAQIAKNIHKSAAYLAQRYAEAGLTVSHDVYFDTIKVKPKNLTDLRVRSEQKKINLRHFDDGFVGISVDETVLPIDIQDLLYLFAIEEDIKSIEAQTSSTASPLIGNSDHARRTPFLTHEVFNSHHSELQLIRYMKRLENKDLSLVHSMIPLGSCTMKLNASAELIPMSWTRVANIHPFAPIDQTRGFQRIFNDLERWLCEVSGYDNFSLQPNSGANGEYAGLLAIKGYLESIGQEQRKICLIPTSAHGTNPASAHLANFEVKVVESDRHGNINFKDLSAKVDQYKDRLAAIMVTYPSTHGVFESSIVDVCNKVHENGGQVYLDGANFNAQVGLCRPGDYGSDVSHFNLHKTFCIPHGGGGPGAGPIGVKSHLAPFLPGHPLVPLLGRSEGAVAATPWGSSSILTITWAYIRLMGGRGLKEATQMSILNANYMARRLENGGYRIVYKDEQGLNAHEFIIDCKPFKKSAGIDVVDIAKRLMDYGFHSPTMAWPVHDCLMIEPTESESKDEMDRFVDSLIAIREEIRQVENGELDKDVNPLKMAPHTLKVCLDSAWNRPYPRELAAFPKPWCHHKLWPTVGRIDDQFGDRNLVCSCPPVDSYE